MKERNLTTVQCYGHKDGDIDRELWGPGVCKPKVRQGYMWKHGSHMKERSLTTACMRMSSNRACLCRRRCPHEEYMFVVAFPRLHCIVETSECPDSRDCTAMSNELQSTQERLVVPTRARVRWSGVVDDDGMVLVVKAMAMMMPMITPPSSSSSSPSPHHHHRPLHLSTHHPHSHHHCHSHHHDDLAVAP